MFHLIFQIDTRFKLCHEIWNVSPWYPVLFHDDWELWVPLFRDKGPIIQLFSPIVSHTVQDLVFIWNMTDPLVVNPDIELPQLDISNNYTTDCTIEYSTGKCSRLTDSVSFWLFYFFAGNFTCLAVVFNLRRRLGYHLFHTYIPSALIVVMSWISFWIKPVRKVFWVEVPGIFTLKT